MDIISIAQEFSRYFSEYPQVAAVAMGGSQSTGSTDTGLKKRSSAGPGQCQLPSGCIIGKFLSTFYDTSVFFLRQQKSQ
jgi:hypothetical protein